MSRQGDRRALTALAAAAAISISSAQEAAYLRIKINNTQVHADPDAASPVLTKLPAGAFVELRGEAGDWLRVVLPIEMRFGDRSVVGYVLKSATAPIAAADRAEAIAAMGRPVARPPGDGIAVGVDHGGKTTWLKASSPRVVALSGDMHQPGAIATSPELREALAAKFPRVGKPDASATWVWVLPADPAAPALSSDRPTFFVSYREVDGIDPNQWTPALVRLVPAGPDWRFLTALPGRADAASREVGDWTIVPNLIQSGAPASVVGQAPGMMNVVVKAPLAAGEYAIVLRPAYARTFRGRYLIGGQDGEGIAFGPAWRFQIK